MTNTLISPPPKHTREQLEAMGDRELNAILRELSKGETWAGLIHTFPRDAAIDAILAVQ